MLETLLLKQEHNSHHKHLNEILDSYFNCSKFIYIFITVDLLLWSYFVLAEL